MKVSCSSVTLAEGLGIVSKAVSGNRRTLSNVLIQTDGSMLRLSATDLEIGINCWIPARIGEPGKALVPAKLLTDLAKTLPDARLDAEMSDRSLSLGLSCCRFRASISTMDADEFPSTTIDAQDRIELDAQVLKRAIGRVAFAAAKDQSRPILSGVSMHFENDGITLAAADGFRIAKVFIATKSIIAEPFSVIVPAKTLIMVGRFIRDDESVIIARPKENNQILFAIEQHIEVLSQLIQGEFPDYERIIPTEHYAQITLPALALLSAVKAAFVFARDAAFNIRLHIEPGGTLSLFHSSNGNECVGEIDCEVEALSGDGEVLDIAFNAEYLSDVLSAIGPRTAIIELIDKNSPGVFLDAATDDFLCVVMPMHLEM